MIINTVCRFIIPVVLPLCLAAAAAGPLDLNDSRVRVPWSDFRQIVDLLAQRDSVPNTDSAFAPREYVLTSVSVSGTIADEKSVGLSARIILQVFASEALKNSGWVRIPIGESDGGADRAVVSGAESGGGSVPLLREDGALFLLLPGRGIHDVTLLYTCPVVKNEGTRRLFLQVPFAAAGYLDLNIPGKRVEATVNGIVRPPEMSRGGTRIQCAFNAGGELSIALSPRAGEESQDAGLQMSPKVFATTGTIVSIMENQVRYRYRIDYQIWHKKVTSFAIAMPDTMPIEQVEGAGIQDWKAERSAEGAVLTVRTNFTPEKEYSFVVDVSRKLDSASGIVRVPEITALGVNRESGYLAVQAAQTIEVLGSDSTKGLTPADPGELPAWMQRERDLLMQFKYSKHPCRLVLGMKRHADMPVLVAIADEAHFHAQFTRDGYALVNFMFMIRNNHKQYLRVVMPPGWKLWSALIGGSAVMPAAGGDDSCRVMIPLKKTAGAGEGAGFVLELVYWKELGAMRRFGGFSLDMPRIDINCRQLHGDLWVPRRYSYSGFTGAVKKVEGYSPRFLGSYHPENYRSGNESGWQSLPRNSLASQQARMKTANRAVALPVEIDVPASGTRFQFSKNLTVAGEKAGLSFRFRKALPSSGAVSMMAWIAAVLTGFFACTLVIRGGSVAKSVLIAVAGVIAGIVELLAGELAGVRASGMFPLLIAGAAAALLNHFARLPKKLPAASLVFAAAALLACSAASVKASESGDGGPDLGETSIAVPWSDFKVILDKLEKRRAPAATRVTPPCDYVIARVRFDGEKSSERECTVAASVSVTVLKNDGWAAVPLGGACAMYPGARLNGVSAPLGKDDNGETIALIRGAGDHELTYRFAVPIDESAGRRSMDFPVPREAAAASFSIVLDDGGYDVTANGRRCAALPVSGKRFAYFGGLGSGDRARVSWQREMSQKGSTAALLIGRAETFYSIGMGLIQIRSAINLTILHQEIRHITLVVPRTVDIIDLAGPAVAAWESADSAGQRFVKVVFNYNVRGATTLTLTAERAYGDSVSRITLPAITLPAAARQEGYVGVGVISTVELTPDEHSPNIVRKDKRELPASFESLGDALYAYHYLSSPYAIGFTLSHHRTITALSAIVSDQSVQSVMREDGKTITRIEMTVKNRGEQFLRLRWRANWQLWSLFCNGNATRPAFDSASDELLVPLGKSTEATAVTRVKIVYLSTGKRYGRLGAQTIEYPSAGMPVQNCGGSVYIPANISPFRYGGNLRAEEGGRKRLFSLFWPDVLRPVDRAATGFYKKMPAPATARAGSQKPRLASRRVVADFYAKNEEQQPAFEQKSEAQFLSRKPEASFPETDADLNQIAGLKAGSGSPHARVTRQGVLGTISGQAKAKTEDTTDLFGKGGFAGSMDESAAQTPQFFFPSGTAESGLLSIPVDISFDGVAKPFSALMLKSGESPKFTFFYRKVPARPPFIVGAIVFLCMLLAASFLTRGLWAGWSKKLVLYGIAAPFAAAFLLTRLVDVPLSCNPLWIVPMLFFIWKSIAGIRIWLRNRQKAETEADAAFRDIGKQEPAAAAPAGNSPAPDGNLPQPVLEESNGTP